MDASVFICCFNSVGFSSVRKDFVIYVLAPENFLHRIYNIKAFRFNKMITFKEKENKFIAK